MSDQHDARVPSAASSAHSWFFREPLAFESLRQRCAAAHAQSKQPYRVLSAPCGAGEDAYAIAITLVELGVPQPSFEVHAADASPELLARAREALYSPQAFRNLAAVYEPYFEATRDGMRVAMRARRNVQFSLGNITDPWLHAGRSFDAVFCRYFDDKPSADVRIATVRNLRRLLSPSGILIVAQADAPAWAELGLSTLGDAVTFTVPREDRPRRASSTTRTRKASVPGLPATRAASRPMRPRSAKSGTQTIAERFEEARSLADQGQLSAARSACEHALTITRSADGYCLLGIIKTAAFDLSGAREAFRNALELDENHYDSLVNLALLCENAGERSAAAELRSRAERAAQARRLALESSAE